MRRFGTDLASDLDRTPSISHKDLALYIEEKIVSALLEDEEGLMEVLTGPFADTRDRHWQARKRVHPPHSLLGRRGLERRCVDRMFGLHGKRYYSRRSLYQACLRRGAMYGENAWMWNGKKD